MLQEDYEDSISTDLDVDRESSVVTDPAQAFLEARQVFKEYPVPGGTIRVDTRIKVSRSPWSVRCVILENGTEIQDGPFAPIEETFDASTVDPEGVADLQLDFARKALAGHLARCKQVERALAGKAPGSGKGKGIAIAAVLALLLGVGGAMGYVLWAKHKTKTASSEQTPKTPETGSVPSGTPTPEGTPAAPAATPPIIVKSFPKLPTFPAPSPQPSKPPAPARPRKAPPGCLQGAYTARPERGRPNSPFREGSHPRGPAF